MTISTDGLSMNSIAYKISLNLTFALLRISITSSKELQPTIANCFDFGRGGQRIAVSVMTPRVPSAPINRCLMSYPVLSLRKVVMLSSISPFAKTTLSPMQLACKLFMLIKLIPPALVLKFPPI